jgi:hypothetical protein
MHSLLRGCFYITCKGLCQDKPTYTCTQHHRIKITVYILKIFNENSNDKNYSLNLIYPWVHVLFTHTKGCKQHMAHSPLWQILSYALRVSGTTQWNIIHISSCSMFNISRTDAPFFLHHTIKTYRERGGTAQSNIIVSALHKDVLSTSHSSTHHWMVSRWSGHNSEEWSLSSLLETETW